ncbi:amidase family protein [Mesorhizobium sp. M0520]|uniref:amidase family protein n=1 Tax=Mesorhizobium sp. M0520 TaxID=2956957 RepID=UPI00333987C7
MINNNCVFEAKDTVEALAKARGKGLVQSTHLVARSLARATLLREEGRSDFTRLWPENAMAAAERQDRLANGQTPSASPLAGLPVAVKDNCDVQRDVTQAGSQAFETALPASRDADCVAKLRAAGAVIVGKTNMSEFAIANTGENRTFGTPRNPLDTSRLVGGSSSGAAASVASGSVIAALGTDTGGSIRGPAALCGLAGFKPSERRVSSRGVTPLSHTFDTIGPIARTITCCAIMDAALSDQLWRPLPDFPLRGILFGVPTTMVLDDLDSQVAETFSTTLQLLSSAGATIIEFPWSEIGGGRWRETYLIISKSEAYTDLGRVVEERRQVIEPHVVGEILSGSTVSMRKLAEALRFRESYVLEAHDLISRFHAILMPTVPILAPPTSVLRDPEQTKKAEYLIGRNNEIANFFDCCAATVPCHSADQLPIGLQIIAKNGEDRRVLAISRSVEATLNVTPGI